MLGPSKYRQNLSFVKVFNVVGRETDYILLNKALTHNSSFSAKN